MTLFYSNKVFHECLYIVVGKQNPGMNLMYLKTKELLYQANTARVRERLTRLKRQLKLVHKHSFFVNFHWLYDLGECI